MKKRLFYSTPLGMLSLGAVIASIILFRYYNSLTAPLAYNGNYEFILFASGICLGAAACALVIYVFRKD
jgi:hypothetical protein